MTQVDWAISLGPTHPLTTSDYLPMIINSQSSNYSYEIILLVQIPALPVGIHQFLATWMKVNVQVWVHIRAPP